MNFKTNKDIIIRIVKNFLGITAVGSLLMLICFMLFAESIIFSKELIGILIAIAILFLGIGGLTSAIFIFFHCCLKEIAKLNKTITKQQKLIANQFNEDQTFHYEPITHNTSTPKDSSKNTGKSIIEEISSLSEDNDDEEIVEKELPEQESNVDYEESTILHEFLSEENNV